MCNGKKKLHNCFYTMKLFNGIAFRYISPSFRKQIEVTLDIRISSPTLADVSYVSQFDKIGPIID